jgi:hypothetical protein
LIPYGIFDPLRGAIDGLFMKVRIKEVIEIIDLIEGS